MDAEGTSRNRERLTARKWGHTWPAHGPWAPMPEHEHVFVSSDTENEIGFRRALSMTGW